MSSLTSIGLSVVRRVSSQRYVARVVDRVHTGQNYVVENLFRPHGVTALYWSFAFVFFYFGFQKPAPVLSPVRVPLTGFFEIFGIPVAAGMAFIGTYEMFMGLLFLLRQIRLVFWLFYAHQAVTFLTLLIIPHVAFQPPWIGVPILGVEFPIAVTGFGAFVVKNLVFVAGFTLLASLELGADSETSDENAAPDGGRD